MNPMHQHMTQARLREVAETACHPGRLTEHELRTAPRAVRTTRTGGPARAARTGLPPVPSWLGALRAALS